MSTSGQPSGLTHLHPAPLLSWETKPQGGVNSVSPLSVLSLSRYFLTSFYTKYDRIHFIINTISLMTVLIPKLPQFHGVRIFGINKY